MGKVFLIDVAKCNGCYDCQIVCKDEHCGNDWRPYAAPQPETGQFWMRLEEKTRGQVPVVRVAYKPVMCAHCASAPCETACPDNAFVRRSDGLLLIDPETCTGCGRCAEACPQGSIYLNAELGIAQKCTGCAHLLDNGWAVPRCVDACAHDAILYDEEESLAPLIEGAEMIKGVAPFGARAYYHNLPKRFVAGSIVDFEADELLIGAEVTLIGAEGSSFAQKTDQMGDFLFDQVPPDVYALSIAAEGYETLTREVDVREIDRSVGDLGMAKR
ncbi:4Fe-4S dicluster domain-containing protein [Raoultibacter phocaeensis]|uniref:4Fe-4S dicluster domain-containing protein n=1 Tax=Raoultibacter phocaeensis TaxID=2479841 RepID=UPI00111A6357|nr:4Fe-4S dicluster domain-containing protein [Raoultibacter phocaeensis]